MKTPIKVSTKRISETDIYVTHKGMDELLQLLQPYTGMRCLLIMDQSVAQLHPWFIKHLRNKFSDVVDAIVPSGETSKTVQEWARILDIALTNKLRRGTPVIAVGGGVTGDLAGFVASSVLRGLPLIHIPTTLLAMVDSAIGGKTGVNHPTGKNLIGSFYQPDIVFADMQFLETLPKREWNCGLGEIIKYACISNPSLFNLIAGCQPGADLAFVANIVQQCAEIKANVVMEDELETGARAFLNFGHTFAHALESHTRYRRFAHGEAVYVGLLAATWYSQKMGAPVDPDRIISFKKTFNLQTEDLLQAVPSLINAMYSDKKIRTGALRLVLLSDWGKPMLQEVEHNPLLTEAWQYALVNAHNN
ncbi:MAG: 3-dehydroquinate synthase [Balneolales bacterium]|nr:3-dehydroquinate synthase [Balneolales bacterium]